MDYSFITFTSRSIVFHLWIKIDLFKIFLYSRSVSKKTNHFIKNKACWVAFVKIYDDYSYYPTYAPSKWNYPNLKVIKYIQLERLVLLWTPTYGRAKAGWPAQTYIQQLCEDTGCSSKDQPEAINDREKWRERIRDIRASGTTWWWWLILID